MIFFTLSDTENSDKNAFSLAPEFPSAILFTFLVSR